VRKAARLARKAAAGKRGLKRSTVRGARRRVARRKHK